MDLATITAEIAKNPELKTGLVGALREDVLTIVKGEGLVFRTKDEETEFLSNYEKNIIPGKVDAEIGKKVGEVHNRYDADIFEATGLKKGPNEKTYEFNKRVLKELAAQAKAGGGDQTLKDQLTAANEALSKFNGYVSPEDVAKIKLEHFQEKVNGRLGSAVDKHTIATPAHLTDDAAKNEYANGIKEVIKSQFNARFTPKQDADGNVTYYADGKLVSDTKTAKPLTEADIIAKHFSAYFMPVKVPGTGAGSKEGEAGTGDASEAGLKTKGEVMEHLSKQPSKIDPYKTMVSGSKEFNKEYSRILKEQGITE